MYTISNLAFSFKQLFGSITTFHFMAFERVKISFKKAQWHVPVFSGIWEAEAGGF